MTNSRSNNLLVSLHKWANQQDENFVTDSFAHLLRSLQQLEPAVAVEIVSRLTKESVCLKPEQAEHLKIETQVSTRLGYPDMRIQGPGFCVLVEVKVESGANQSQLARYRMVLGETDAAVTYLVFLTRYSVDLDENQEQADCNLRWYKIADWLREFRASKSIGTSIGRFLTEQFVEFLEIRGIAMGKVSSDVAAGIGSMRNLLGLVGEALDSLGHKSRFSSKRNHVGYKFNQSSNQMTWVGIDFEYPESLYFNTYFLEYDNAAAEEHDLDGQIFASELKEYSKKLQLSLSLSPDNTDFFHQTPAEQLASLESFIHDCVSKAESITPDSISS